MAVRRQIDYGATLGVPWGISESAYSAVDRHGTYQYKAFGVPGSGLKRGLGDELVVAPYATALAAMLVPAQSAKNLRRLAALGLEGEYGFFDAVDYTDRGAGRRRARRPTLRTRSIVRTLHGASPGHDARRAGQRAARRPHGRRASTPTPACRPPSCCCRNGGRAMCRLAASRPSTTCACRRRRRRAGTPLSHAAHGVSARAVPVERPARLGRDERRRRQLFGATAWR